MHSPLITGEIFILTMSCISDDELQVAIHRREDIFRWLRDVDHEGSHWTVHKHIGDPIAETIDITDDILREYGQTATG